MTIDPKIAGVLQFLDSMLAALDIGACAGHPYFAAAFLLMSIYFVVQGAWNLAS